MFEAIAIGPFLIWTRVVFLLLGICLSAEFFFRLAQRAKLPLTHFKQHPWWYVGAFCLAGRIGAILAEPLTYFHHPARIFIVWDGNFSFLSAAVGIGVVLNIITKKHHATFLQWLDVLLPAATFGLVFEWLGKFTSGDSYGKPTDLFWGVSYDTMSVRYTVPLHPVQLYYALFFLALTFILLVIRHYAKRAGAETLWGIAIACVGMFLLEYIRGDIAESAVLITMYDVSFFLTLFISLTIFAIIELKVSQRFLYGYMGLLVTASIVYFLIRSSLTSTFYYLRVSQFIATLVLLSTVVYVITHRRRYPHL